MKAWFACVVGLIGWCWIAQGLRFHRLSDVVARSSDDQSPSASVFLQTAAKVSMPEKCTALVTMHGQTAIDNFFFATTQLLPSDTPEQVCTKALDCKRLLSPLITNDNKYKRPCPGDCSGNGVCVNGLCSCSPGYSGDACDKMRCPGKCSERGVCKLGKCFCEPGFSGDNCELIADCPMYASRACGGHGICDRGLCFCHPGFTGAACDKVARCPKDCSNSGFCIHGKCFCSPGLGGADCSVEEYSDRCPNDCSGKGDCVRGKCRCVSGHFGDDCSSVIECPKHDGLICSGHGSCQNGHCDCHDGFVGYTCSIKQQCPGNGTCSDRGLCLDGKCYCYPGASGDACDLNTPCANGCSERGVCHQGKCLCHNGFYGEDCSKGHGPSICQLEASKWCGANNSSTPSKDNRPVFDFVTLRRLQAGVHPCPKACSGTGVCLNGTCACLPGFGGGDCSQASSVMQCPNHCSFRGVCLFGRCKCLPLYAGADCSEIKSKKLRHRLDPTACPNQCGGHGDCWNGTCVCHPGYASHDCSLEIPCRDNCNGRGMCDRGRCFCYPGFEGSSCETPSRCPNGCSGSGLCFYGKCFCQAFYAGEDCSKTPHCPKGCVHGVCRGNNQCACEPGWTGVMCSEKVSCDGNCNGGDRGHCYLTASPKCACHSKWGGAQCERDMTKCDEDCNGRGVCLMGECTCDVGYTGPTCKILVGGGSMYSAVNSNIESANGTNATPGTPPRFMSLAASLASSAASSAAASAASATVAGGAMFPAESVERLPDAPSLSSLLAPSDRSLPLEELKDAMAGAGEPEAVVAALESVSAHLTDKSPRFASSRAALNAQAEASVTAACPNDCSKQGLCANGLCFCNPGYTGLDCAAVVNCPNACSGHGICKYGQCFCEPEYSGESCLVPVNKARAFPQGWVTVILAALAFFAGFFIGRKSVKQAFDKLMTSANPRQTASQTDRQTDSVERCVLFDRLMTEAGAIA